MTNPTPPLTTEILQEIRERYSKDFAGAMALMGVYKSRIDAEAAQQNAELVATISQLNSDIAGLSGKFLRVESDYKLAVEEIKVLKGELAQAEIKACQRGKAWIELSSQNERLNKALKAVIENDKTHYNHHEPRPDGKLPKEEGGTIWLTPKEIAKRNLPQPPKEVE